MVPTENEPALIKVVRQKYTLSTKNLTQINKETGIPYLWLRDFFQGRYKQNPSIQRVSTLYEYFTGSKLEDRL